MSPSLRPAESLKFRLLAEGITITPDARRTLVSRVGSERLTPADFASTSGIILCIDGDVWVNAPIAEHNPNFVVAPGCILDVAASGLVVRDGDVECDASFWIPPAYHGKVDPQGVPWNNFVFTHGDRVRVSPIRGCSMACKFCNVPYEDRYATKPVESLLAALRVAFADPVQPARHVLISGGTPRPADHGYLQDVYAAILTAFPDVEVDLMMVPAPGLLDVASLASAGVGELSVNLELWDDDIARRLMPQKHRQGREHYLRFISDAVDTLGSGRVRSMLMVGLEPLSSTLAGVDALLARGAVPVLSPFRPDPATPLVGRAAPDAALLREAFLGAEEMALRHGTTLGPRCVPCSHNTLTLPSRDVAADPCPAGLALV